MKITDQIYALKIPFEIPVAPGKILKRFVYSYLVVGEELCLIDSGVSGSESLICDFIRQLGIEPQALSLLILTHAHPDHIGSARAIREATGCTVAAHAKAKRWIEDVDLQLKERPVPGFKALVDGSTCIDRVLQHGEVLDLGGPSLQVLHTPGHSQGSISLWSQRDGVLFAGDAVPQPNALPIYDDAVISAESINVLKALDGITYLLASWNDPRSGVDAYKALDDGLAYLKTIHAKMQAITDEDVLCDPMALCKQMVHSLGLPGIAVNPLVARSFASHVRVLDQAIAETTKSF